MFTAPAPPSAPNAAPILHSGFPDQTRSFQISFGPIQNSHSNLYGRAPVSPAIPVRWPWSCTFSSNQSRRHACGNFEPGPKKKENAFHHGQIVLVTFRIWILITIILTWMDFSFFFCLKISATKLEQWSLPGK